MKVKEFVEKAISFTKVNNLYGWGCFLNKYNENGYLLSDCSGLIKGILWGYPENGVYASNGVPDIDANTMMLSYCDNVSSDFSTIQYGELVQLDNHIGIYIGNNQVVESTPIWENGIQITGLHDRKWLRHGKFRYIDYSTVQETQPTKDIDTIAIEVIRGVYGNGEDRKVALEKLGYNYTEVQQHVNELITGLSSGLNLVDIAYKVIRGDYGNGEDRKINLERNGYNYDDVQKIVDSILSK